VTRGLYEGVSGMKNGETRLMVIPDSVAYSHQGFYAPSIPGKKRFVIPPDRLIILEVTMK
jgi:FKBP-type peptidyl-prolyl cis-trans isomerase